MKIQLVDLTHSSSGQIRFPVASLPDTSICTPETPEQTQPLLLARIEELEQQLKVTRQRASQSNREHLKLMHDHNVAQGEVCHLKFDLAQAQKRLAYVESKLPRFLRFLLGI
jgi:hypothetical protein